MVGLAPIPNFKVNKPHTVKYNNFMFYAEFYLHISIYNLLCISV